jgi:type II secretory pathway pseudopilin PulG
MSRPNRQRGYALLMVLLVLAVAGVALAATVRVTAGRMLRANQAQRRLQVHWGSLSCRELVLPQAEAILQAREKSANRPAASVQIPITLGGMTFNLLVCDEQAKANVNRLLAGRSMGKLAVAAERLQRDLRSKLAVDPVTVAAFASRDPRKQSVYDSFDQVFTVAHPSQLVSAAGYDASPASRWTLWGGGTVNFHRAPRDVMEVMLGGVLSSGQAAELSELARSDPTLSLGEAVKRLDLPKPTARRVRGVLTDSSGCHSLWVIVEDGPRNWYRLFIAGGQGSQGMLAW